ncbi:MAG: GCN5-related N-acetyltransferase [Actinomycetia bacterium]|nr:GCN5-related N-acetyltransferase [Actinomycetes bacterium]
MRIEPLGPADEKTVRACYDVMLAAHKVDEPVEPPTSCGAFGLYLREGWEKTPGEVWCAVDDAGAVNGFYRMHLPDLENLDRASGGPVVHPAVRRHGIGRELLRHEGGRAEANGRSLFSASTTVGTAGDPFARAVGARLDLEEVRRVQHLREIPPGKIASLRASAEKAAAGYSLLSWTGVTPDEYCGPLAEVFNAFNDAPHGENEEPEIWDAQRVRERTGTGVRAGVMRGYSMAAFRDTTGEMAAFSEVLVDPETPQWGFQQLTAVIRSHRGHRLGLLVKTAMLELLAPAEPELEWIATGNAATNEHMIAVNDQLGYKVVEPGWRFYEMPVPNMR